MLLQIQNTSVRRINKLSYRKMSIDQRKRKRRCEFECSDHVFLLQALKNNPSKYDIEVQFCPKYQRDPLPPEHTYPEFNNDYKYYTSAFVLGVDKRILIKNQQQEIMDHQKQIRDSLEKHNQLIFPRPNSKHSLCSVCKEHYKNYYLHIASEEHRQKISYSHYNNHIKHLCNLYVELWEGAEERADQQAEKRAQQDEERRQRLLDEALLHQEEDSNSLLDCQRGEQDPEQSKQQEFAAKSNYRKNERQINNEDTVPINSKGYKRGAIDRSLYEPPIRKRYTTGGQFNPTHAARERKERQYERQRDKMMRGTEFQHFKKHFRARPAKEDDVFIVLQPIQGHQDNIEEIKKTDEEKVAKKIVQETPKKSVPFVQIERQKNEFLNQDEESFEQKQVFHDKQSAQIQEENRQIKLRQMNQISHEQGELSDSRSERSSSSSISSAQDNKTIRRQAINQRIQRPDWKMDPRMHPYPYPYPPMQIPHIPPKGMPPQAYKQAYKGINNQYAQHYKNLPQAYKRMPPYYYGPYGYPMYEPQYMKHNEKGYENAAQKQKAKGHEKPYQYHMGYPWSYHPYYMPPMPPIPPSQHSQQHPQQHMQHSQHPQHPQHVQHSQHSQHPQHPQHAQHTQLTQQPPHMQHQHYPLPHANPNRPDGGPEGISGKASSQNPNNPYVGGTSININFPMYMCPPHPSMPPAISYPMPNPRYPMHPMMNPYMGYPQGTYMNQQQRTAREGEYPANQQPTTHYPPPHPPTPNTAHPQIAPHHPYPTNPGYPPTNMPHQSANNPAQNVGNHQIPPHPYYYPHHYSHYQSQMAQHQQKSSLNNKQV